MDAERLDKILLQLGNAVMAQHQCLQELMTHLSKAGEHDLAAKMLANQEKAILALQRFVAEVDRGQPGKRDSLQ